METGREPCSDLLRCSHCHGVTKQWILRGFQRVVRSFAGEREGPQLRLSACPPGAAGVCQLVCCFITKLNTESCQ